MTTMRFALMLCIALALPISGLPQEQHPMPLETRVNEAKLIVIGKIQTDIVISRHHCMGHVEIEQQLFGTVSTNKTVVVGYATDKHLIPGIASTTHRFDPTNRYICFLTYNGKTQISNSPPEFSVVGSGRSACDGFELATEKAVQNTKALIVEKNRSDKK